MQFLSSYYEHLPSATQVGSCATCGSAFQLCLAQNRYNITSQLSSPTTSNCSQAAPANATGVYNGTKAGLFPFSANQTQQNSTLLCRNSSATVVSQMWGLTVGFGNTVLNVPTSDSGIALDQG